MEPVMIEEMYFAFGHIFGIKPNHPRFDSSSKQISSIREARDGFGLIRVNTAFLNLGRVILELRLPSLMSAHISLQISSKMENAWTIVKEKAEATNSTWLEK